jgi:hypothetical protein
MKIAITIEINETDSAFNNLSDVERLSIDIAFNKYKFDILKDKQEKRLEYIATEISLHSNDVLVGNTCYNLKEVLYLNNELQKHNLSINTVYVPSEERIEARKNEAMVNVRLHSRWVGSSEEEVEKNFENFRATIQEIMNGLSKTAIEFKRV